MNKKTAVQPLSENTRKAIIIAAIVVVAVIILSVSLALVLRPSEKSPDDQTGGSTGSSTLTIRNGDFAYTSSEGTAYPKAAQNWTRYGYKAKSGSDTHDFESISTYESAVMGIVNTSEDDEVEENWTNTVVSNLADEGLTGIANPGKPNADADDDNVYMIATKEDTAASILSDSFSVTSGTSVKITLWLNTYQLEEGSNAVIMIQKSTVSALSKYWYAYNFEVEPTEENEWVQYTFHIFNRESSTQYLRVSIGIGNVYSGEEYTEKGDILGGKDVIKGSGVLFIDEIEYEKVNADEYRRVVDAKELQADDYVEPTDTYQPYKILENEDITDDSVYLDLKYDDNSATDELGYQGYLDETKEQAGDEYSPFTLKDDFVEPEDGSDVVPFKIYKVTDQNKALRLENNVLNNILSSLVRKDHHHISFWVRVNRTNMVAKANVHVQYRENASDEWEDLKDGSWTAITTSQDIDTDGNAGWVKYDIYIKPSAVKTDISILFNFGDENKKDLVAKGTMYVTKPAYEKISYKDYESASGTNVKKLDLVGQSATASITNGSFSSISSSGLQPSGWTPAFAGDNSIYRDGLGDKFDLVKTTEAVLGSGVVSAGDNLPTIPSGNADDDQQKVLQISNNIATSYGYISSNISLSSKTAYVISVLAKADNDSGNPYIYLLNTDSSLDRDARVIAAIESAQNLTAKEESLLGQETPSSEIEGWQRYYFIIVTGDTSRTVQLALFNGSLTDSEKTETGTVYYDDAQVLSLGTYSLVVDEDAEEGSEEAKYYKVEWADHRFAESDDGFGANFGELLEMTVEDGDDNLIESWGIFVEQPSEEDWAAMKLIPEEEEEPEEDNTTTTTPSDVDLGLLFSVISSVALLAAMLIVLVIRLFREGKFKRKAA